MLSTVMLSQLVECPRWIWRAERFHPSVFYGFMTFMAFETASFFGDVLGVLGLFK
jgi:hypothetical protein